MSGEDLQGPMPKLVPLSCYSIWNKLPAGPLRPLSAGGTCSTCSTNSFNNSVLNSPRVLRARAPMMVKTFGIAQMSCWSPSGSG